MRLIHPVKSLKDTAQRILRNTHSGIGNCHIEELVIRIQRHSYPSVVYIVLDRIFYQVTDRRCKFQLVHICLHRAETVKNQIDVSLVRDRTQALQDILQQLVDRHMLDLKICVFLIHLDQRQKVSDDPVLTVDLRCDVTHKLLIQILRDTLLSYQRICEDFHGSHRSLEFMRDI